MRKKWDKYYKEPTPQRAEDRDQLRKLMQMIWNEKPIQSAHAKTRWKWQRLSGQIEMNRRNKRSYRSGRYWTFKLEENE